MREPRDDGPPFQPGRKTLCLKKRPGLTTPPNRTSGAVAPALHVRLNPVDSPRETPVRDVLSPSLRAHIGDFGSAAATSFGYRRKYNA